MTCEHIQTQLNELPAAEFRSLDAGMLAHVESCAACHHAYEQRRVAASALAEAVSRTRAGDGFRQRILETIDGEFGSDARDVQRIRRGGFSWSQVFRPSPAWAALAFALVLASGYNYLRTLGHFSPTGQMPATMERFIDDVGHDAYLYARNAQSFEVRTQEPAEVTNWFAPRLEFPIEIPSRLDANFRLEGARLWHTVSRLSALVQYSDAQGEVVTLFVISSANLADQGGREVEREGRVYRVGESFQYKVAAWQDGPTAYALVGRISEDELIALVGAVSH